MTKTIDISSEKYREYVTSDGAVYRIDAPKELHILDGGSHRVIDNSGVTHRPPRCGNDYAIRWTPKNGQPSFVA